MATSFWVVDTFCDDVFRGTPSSVFFVDEFGDEGLLQNVSMEINTPETIFIRDLHNGNFESMCFTPNSKGLSFGNGLFAAAKIINEKNPDLKEFHIMCGVRVFAIKITDGGDVTVRFSAITLEKVPMPLKLPAALNGEIIVSIAKCKNELIVEIRNPNRLTYLQPNIDTLLRINYKSFIITADTHYQTNVEYDFCAKVFAPKLGVFSDITTPIAHSKLAEYWASRMKKTSLVGLHTSNRRCGKTNIVVNKEFMYVTGRCEIVTEGEMLAF
ncbi:MAG: PhzF family phenazine biosynthesis protein [Holosporales bacterium]|nr:PhzF family phenazine biosynthesis protein [Holosporales bacterium]